MRLLTILVISAMAALPVGALLGLVGALYGSAILVGAFVAYLILRNVRVGLVVIVAIITLLPFAAVPVDIGFEPTILDLALALTFFVWLAGLASEHRDERLVTVPPTTEVLVFVGLATISFVAGLGHAPLTANVARHFVEILLSVLIFVLVINTVRTKRHLQILVVALMVCGALASVIGIVLYVLPDDLTVRLLSLLRIVRYPSGPEVLRYIEDNPALAQRATSTSVDPNVLGGMLIFVSTITAAQAVARRPVIPRGWVIAMLAAMFTCLLLTYSRGSFLGLAAAVGLMGILRYRKLLLVGLVVVVALLFLPVTQDYVMHFTEGVQGEDLATQMRFGEYKDALTLIRRYPWFGVGFAGTPEIDTYLGVSSVYLLIAEEMGLVGLSGFLAAMASFFYAFGRALGKCHPGSELEPEFLGTSLAVAGALVGGIFDHYLFNLDFPHAAALMWLVVGLGAVAARLVNEGEPSPSVEESMA